MNKQWRDAVGCLMVIGAMCLCACSTQAPQPAQVPPPEKHTESNDILFTALGLVGIPYRYGGTTPARGFDCSGLIQYVYAVGADIKLPRTVAGMNTFDAPAVEEASLEAGDLVIFATGSGKRPSHAGIYVGDGRFVHSPRTGGVVRMDLLSNTYWQRRYLSAKRPLAIR